MEYTSLDLMSTEEIVKYLGRNRFRSIIFAGVKSSNNKNEATIATYVKGREDLGIMIDDIHKEVAKFRDKDE